MTEPYFETAYSMLLKLKNNFNLVDEVAEWAQKYIADEDLEVQNEKTWDLLMALSLLDTQYEQEYIYGEKDIDALINEFRYYGDKKNIEDFASDDNKIIEIKKTGTEYVIEIEKWNGLIYYFQTINCKGIIYIDDVDLEELNIEDVNLKELNLEIGEIEKSDLAYVFRDAWDNEIFLKIIADDLKPVDTKEFAD